MKRPCGLASLPAARIPPALEAGNEQDSAGFHLVKQVVRKAPHQGASAALMNNRETERRPGNELDGVFDA
jgi:hypothetical protein